MEKTKTSFMLTENDKKLIVALAEKLDISQSKVVSMGVSLLAKKEKLS